MTNSANKEKEVTGLTNYAAAVNWLHKGLVLCNKMPEIDPSVFDNMHKSMYDEETDEYREIYQWYITNFNEWDVEWMEETFPDLIFTYSDLLDVFVLCVDHWGTPWRGVMTTCTKPQCERACNEEI